MPVLKMKPCLLWYLTAEEGSEDENGNYHPGASSWEGAIPCDAVPAGKADEIAYEDGTLVRYSYTVYLPALSMAFTVGDRVKIRFFGNTEREFTVKGFHRYQHQCKLWV